jgi:hypothetical protein
MTIPAQQLVAELTPTNDDGHDFFDLDALKNDLSVSDMIDLVDAALDSKINMNAYDVDFLDAINMNECDGDFLDALNAIRSDDAYANDVSALMFVEYRARKAEFLESQDE